MGVNPMNFAGSLGSLYPTGMGSSAAQFQLPTEKHQVKLFVGGLAFPTTENDMGDYFGELGKVENTIVMRDKITNRGRGFGFVLLSFKDEEAAKQAKAGILDLNRTDGHFILNKRVDVKSADDYGGKGAETQPNINAGLPNQNFR